MHRIKLAVRGVAAVGVLLLTLACNKKTESSSETGTGTPSTLPSAAPMRITSIQLGKALNADKSLTTEAADFGVRDVIYAVVSTEGAATDAKLDAKWTFQNGKAVSDASQSVSPAGGMARHEFHIQKASAWPKGTYTVEIMLDGTSVGTKQFVIR